MVPKGVRSIYSRKTRENIIFIPEAHLSPPNHHTSSLFPIPENRKLSGARVFTAWDMLSHTGVGKEGFPGDPFALGMSQASVTKLMFPRAPSHGAPWLQALEPKGNRRSVSSMYIPHIHVEPWKYVATRQSLCQPNKARGTP